MDNQTLLSRLRLPSQLKELSTHELNTLCAEIRDLLYETISHTGGHLASNLGVVELSVMLHVIFETPKDSILFDVGHQCYTHKILTGRLSRVHTLRQQDGISGFPKNKESEHDAFVSGHAGNAISAARGIAAAKKLRKESGKVIAVVGDGALTNGLTFEGMNNNAGRTADNLIVILNDNEMSISKNVGALAKHLAKIRSKPSYFGAKDITRRILDRIPLVGKPVKRMITRTKTALKESLYHSNYFEAYGFTYLGPVNGHDIESLRNVLERAKVLPEPVLIHIDTVKGKGFTQAEENPGAYHGVSNTDLLHNKSTSAVMENSFSVSFGKCLMALGEQDNRICAITAAMKYATGLNFFYKKFPDRFFDVGIAEAHGVTFTAGLAAGGMLPVFAVYSTFLQRAYDEVLHDAAIEKTHIVLAVDRAGIVGDDGETHQGLFDVAFLSTIPDVTIFSPFSYMELELTLQEALYRTDGVAVIRYPKGGECEAAKVHSPELSFSFITHTQRDAKTLVVTYGKEYAEVLRAQGISKIPFHILKLTRVMPIDSACVKAALSYEHVLFVEEGIQNGGAAEHFHTMLSKGGYKGRYAILAVDNQFVPQASIAASLRSLGLDGEGVAQFVLRESSR